MYKKIELIINEWDPLQLFPFAPKDEYEDEINKITLLVKKDSTVDKLALSIENIFLESFGDGIINASKEEYKKIALNILSSI